MELRDIVAAYMRDHDLSQREFARLCGVSNSSISLLLKGTNPKTGEPIKQTIETLKKFAGAMNMSFHELALVANDIDIDLTGGPRPSNNSFIRIPVLGSVPAGVPIEAVEDVIDWEDIPATMTRGGKEYFALRVAGDSMFPKFLDGDIVIVHRTPVCDSGDDCVVYVNGYDATLKTVLLSKDGGLSLRPINTNYEPRSFTRAEVVSLPVSIAGVVVELRRKVKS